MSASPDRRSRHAAPHARRPSDASPPESDGLPDEVGREDAGGPAVQWLAAYLPAYGTSTLLHVAVAMVAWMLSMQVVAPVQGGFNSKGN